MSIARSAAPSMAGYLFQARYALLLGLRDAKRHPSHVLSIETFDDLALEDSDGLVQLIQTKHHRTRSAISDSSVDLWKTIHGWIEQVDADPTTAGARLVLLTTNSAADQSALSKLRAWTDRRDESHALQLLRSVAATSENTATKSARDAFLALSDVVQELLLENIWLVDDAPNLIDVRDEIEQELHYSAPREHVSDLTDRLEGWWFDRVSTALIDSGLSRIPLTSIQNKVSELREHFKLAYLPLDDDIDHMDPVTEMPEDDRTFIRQMNIIRVPDPEARATVHDYYRAYAQRSRWIRQDLLLDGEVTRYDEHLHDAWQRRFFAHTADLNDEADRATKEMQGKRVFRWAREYHRPLRNRDELWLSSGSFQMLADELQVGWHPNYLALLASEEPDS